MTARRPLIPQRIPVFLGCEGESEQAYGQLLNQFLREKGLHIHLEVVALTPGAGDPMARLLRADQEIRRRAERRTAFRLKAVIMDSDQVVHDSARRQQAEHHARKLQIHIIWQEPCHEALLLRHFPDFAQRRPPTSREAASTLVRFWPEYRKPMTRLQLQDRIAFDDIERAARVEPGLAIFLNNISQLSRRR